MINQKTNHPGRFSIMMMMMMIRTIKIIAILLRDKYVSDTIIKFSHVIANLVRAQLVLQLRKRRHRVVN